MSYVASRHIPMIIKPIVREQKIGEMSLTEFAKAIQDAPKVNYAPHNPHMYL